MIRKTSAALLLGLSLMACNNQNNKKSAPASETSSVAKGEWQSLFDGKTTKGWHRYGAGAIDSVWQAKDGLLYLDVAKKKAAGIRGDWDIVTEQEYEDFELELEWKISKNGNSGIIFYVHEDKKYRWPWETGMEMQVLDDAGHPDGKIIKHRAGDLYDLISASKEAANPVGEWNKVRVRSEKAKLDMYLNDVKVVSTTLWDDQWKALVAGSKFKNMPDFGTYRRGRIGLQDHGNDVWYRNIRIKSL